MKIKMGIDYEQFVESLMGGLPNPKLSSNRTTASKF